MDGSVAHAHGPRVPHTLRRITIESVGLAQCRFKYGPESPGTSCNLHAVTPSWLARMRGPAQFKRGRTPFQTTCSAGTLRAAVLAGILLVIYIPSRAHGLYWSPGLAGSPDRNVLTMAGKIIRNPPSCVPQGLGKVQLKTMAQHGHEMLHDKVVVSKRELGDQPGRTWGGGKRHTARADPFASTYSTVA